MVLSFITLSSSLVCVKKGSFRRGERGEGFHWSVFQFGGRQKKEDSVDG